MRIIVLCLLLAGCAAMDLPTGDPIRIGMASHEVVKAWGKPDEINTTQIEGAPPREQWVYETYLGRTTGSRFRFIYIELGRVVAIQD
jgi:hypothetical protein